MGATAAIGALVSRGMGTLLDQHRLGEHRLYANLGPLATIIGGPSESDTLDQISPRQQLWFRDGQFLFTHSPFTKES